jgi:hypothetical protein
MVRTGPRARTQIHRRPGDGRCCSQRLDPIDTGLFATPSGWYPFAPVSQLHETLKALPPDPIQPTTRGRPDPSLLFGLRRVLDPKPACPLSLGRIRHRSESPAQADGYHFIVIDPALLGIGQKVTSISHAGVLRAPGQGDGRRGPAGQCGHSEVPPVRRPSGIELGLGRRPWSTPGAGRPRAAPAAERPAGDCARSGAMTRVREAAIASRWTRRPTVRTCPFQPRGGCRRENSYRCRYFGGPANSGSPVALRPPLTRGLPFRPAFTADAARFSDPSQCIVAPQGVLPPVGNRGAMKEASHRGISCIRAEPRRGSSGRTAIVQADAEADGDGFAVGDRYRPVH